MQQASILGNLEELGVLKSSTGTETGGCDGSSGDDNVVPAVVEFGAGRGYLTQMLADCYGIKRVYLVERKAYKLKVSRFEHEVLAFAQLLLLSCNEYRVLSLAV